MSDRTKVRPRGRNIMSAVTIAAAVFLFSSCEKTEDPSVSPLPNQAVEANFITAESDTPTDAASYEPGEEVYEVSVGLAPVPPANESGVAEDGSTVATGLPPVSPTWSEGVADDGSIVAVGTPAVSPADETEVAVGSPPVPPTANQPAVASNTPEAPSGASNTEPVPMPVTPSAP